MRRSLITPWMLLATLAGAAQADDAAARWLARVAAEEAVVVPGARLLVATGRLHDPEAAQLPSALATAYAALRRGDGVGAAPTQVALDGDDGEVLIVDGGDRPRGAVIFLHGFAGGFALPCWQLAQAARAAALATLCPTVGWRGDWWTARGARVLRRTVALARARGFARLYLAGLSNGAVGAARLAPKLRGTFAGVVVISGAGHDSAPPGVPVLALQGVRDTMSSAGVARDYARRAGGDYHALAGGHFAFLLRAAEAERVLADWLRRH